VVLRLFRGGPLEMLSREWVVALYRLGKWRDAGRGLALRLGHGSRYLSDHFQYWGIRPRFAFIEQPQTNGVAERFIRTLKEQVIYGRVLQNLKEVREAARRFVDTYNREWLVEKNCFKSPSQVRAQWLTQASLARAAKKTCVQETGCGTLFWSK
jgi:transposase InsO family protein